MVNKLRIAIVGFGPFGRGVEEGLRGDVGEILIIGRDVQHLEKFSKDDGNYNPNVRVLQGEIDETIIDEALKDLEILPRDCNGSAEGETKKTVDWAVVDMGDIGMNDYVVERVAPHAGMVVVAVRNPAHIEALMKLGASWVICPDGEASERVALSIHGLEARDIVRISDNLDVFEASVDVPDSFTGISLQKILNEIGVRVLFFVRSTPIKKGRGKKVVDYKEEVFDPKDLSYRISEEDMLMRVRGAFSQVKKLAKELK